MDDWESGNTPSEWQQQQQSRTEDWPPVRDSLEDDLANGQAGLLQSREPSTMHGEGEVEVENHLRETPVEDDEFGGESTPRANHYVPQPPPACPTSVSGQPVTMSDFLAYMQWKDEADRRQREEDRREMERRRQDDNQRHQELMELQHRRLQQEQQAEEARRTAAARQEEQRKKDREIDRKLREAPQLPKMSGDTDVEIFLADFEMQMKDLEIPKERWVMCLQPLLSNWARGAVDILGETDRKDFDAIKKALLNSFAGAKGSLGYRALTTGREKGQSATQFLSGIHSRWKHWIGELPMEQALTKIVMALGELHLPYQCKSFVQARNPATIQDMANLIEQFFAERGFSWDDVKWKSAPPFQQQWSRPYQGSSPHWKGNQERPINKYPNSAQPAQHTKEPTDHTTSGNKRHQDPTCYICNKPGHFAWRCPDKPACINRIEDDDMFMVEGRVGNTPTRIMLDSGASVSLVPARLVSESDYTGRHRKVKGAVGQECLPVARLSIGLMEGEEDLDSL